MPRTRAPAPQAAPHAQGRAGPRPAGPAPAATGGYRVEIEGLIYVLDRPPRPHGRRSVAVVRLAEHPTDPGFRDRLDLFGFRSRESFARRVADAFGREVGQVMGHLAVILDQAERELAGELRAEVEELTPERRAAAEALLAAPDLLDQAATALEGLGHVGEPEVKRLCYLVATSRLLDKPLSALLLAPSGTGKSTVLDAITALMPAEQVETLARLTPHSLYYMGEEALRNKLVVVDEYEGAGDADHPLRVLQSKGELRLSVTVKGKAEAFLVRGPVAVMSGTTATKLDAQNTSRCLELTLDDSPAQTRRIQQAQARAWAGRGGHGGVDLQLWQDAQRVLQASPVVIPFAERLRFPARTTTDRRGSAKLLGLIAAHALLHQRQRRRDRAGRLVATPADYRAVHDLLRPLVEQHLDGLSPRAGRAYRLLLAAEAPLTRREVATRAGWHYMTAARAVEDLLAQELVRAVDGSTPRRYRPAGGQVLGEAAALTPPGEVG